MRKGPHSWTSTTFLDCRNGGVELLQRSCIYLLWFQFLVVLSVGLVQACSDDDEEFVSTVEMVLRSKFLIYGKVLRKIADHRYNYSNDIDVYTAEMEVFCVLKGPRTNRIINITEAGYIPGRCYSTTLSENQNFIVIADDNGSTYRPVDTEIAATSSNLYEVSTACGLDPKYPYGVSEKNARERCLTPVPHSQCKDETFFTTTTTTTMPSTTDEEYPFYETHPSDPSLSTDGGGNPTFSKSPTSPTSSSRLSGYHRLLQLVVAAATHLVFVFLPLSPC